MDKRYGILIVSVTIFVLYFVGSASATNWSVDGSGGADFTAIQDAINNAKDGDTIMVHPGVYYEEVVVDKSVTLMGNGQPVVDARGGESAILLSADGITLVGFTATNSESTEGYAGINVISSNNIITGNNVSNNHVGIYFSYNNSFGNTITGNNVSNNEFGIYFDYSSSNNIITDNNVSNNGDGIRLYTSSNNLITGNHVSNNKRGIYLFYFSNNNLIIDNVFVNDGLSVSSSYQNTVEDNTVNGKPLVYLEDASDYRVKDAGQVILVNCNNISVENLVLSNTRVGVELLKTRNSRISNNTVCNNGDGIRLDESCNNNITGNNASNNEDGIRLDESSNNNITGNNASNNGDGISLYTSSNNNITGNHASNNNKSGIWLRSSSNNTITGNNVSNNEHGIYLHDFSNNLVYLNNFINNTDNVHTSDSTNIWNSTEKITCRYNRTTYESYLGNYGDDYTGSDTDGNGIGDTSYSINLEKDNYPLMKTFENYFVENLSAEPLPAPLPAPSPSVSPTPSPTPSATPSPTPSPIPSIAENISWAKAYGSDKSNVGINSVQQTEDGYVIAGWTGEPGHTPSSVYNKDLWVAKLDINGGIEWQRSYGESRDEEAYSIQSVNGSYIVIAQ